MTETNHKELKDTAYLLVQVGEADPIGGERSNKKLVEAYRKNASIDDIELFVYHECRHEIYNELNKEAIIEDLVNWVDERVG